MTTRNNTRETVTMNTTTIDSNDFLRHRRRLTIADIVKDGICNENSRHCETPFEKNNVFDRNSNNTSCWSDPNGSYSILPTDTKTSGNSAANDTSVAIESQEQIPPNNNDIISFLVPFTYQIQTTIQQRASTLRSSNDTRGTLFFIEKKISDLLVSNLFANTNNCTINTIESTTTTKASNSRNTTNHRSMNRKKNRSTNRQQKSIMNARKTNQNPRRQQQNPDNKNNDRNSGTYSTATTIITDRVPSSVTSTGSKEQHQRHRSVTEIDTTTTTPTFDLLTGLSAQPYDEIVPGLDGGKDSIYCLYVLFVC